MDHGDAKEEKTAKAGLACGKSGDRGPEGGLFPQLYQPDHGTLKRGSCGASVGR